jgi:hypothetical protein
MLPQPQLSKLPCCAPPSVKAALDSTFKQAVAPSSLEPYLLASLQDKVTRCSGQGPTRVMRFITYKQFAGVSMLVSSV